MKTLKAIYVYYKRHQIERRLMNVQGLVWYIENGDKVDEICDLLYPELDSPNS